MPSIHRVIEYSGMNYRQVLELPTDMFLLMVKNHVMDELNGSQEGRDYIEKCKRLNTTEPNRNTVKDFIKRGG